MKVYKSLIIAFLCFVSTFLNVMAQNAIGQTTNLLHPSGIPATVTTTQSGTITNVDGKNVARNEDTDLDAHEEAVRELEWSGFRRQ